MSVAALDFYFDFVSPFGWIAAEQIGGLARETGRDLAWHPILLKATVTETMGLPPLLDIPLKGAYTQHDFLRCARYFGLVVSPEVRFVFSPIAPARAVIWAKQHAPAVVEDLVLALYREHWSTGGDIADADAVVAVGARLGLDPEALHTGLEDSAMKQGLRESVTVAIGRGVFGSPTVIVEGEVFWGADRLPMLREWIARGGW